MSWVGFKVHEALEDGFCEALTPPMNGYKMACCDCSLVHEVEFRAIKVVERREGGEFVYEELDPNEYRVQIRVRRDTDATKELREEVPDQESP